MTDQAELAAMSLPERYIFTTYFGSEDEALGLTENEVAGRLANLRDADIAKGERQGALFVLRKWWGCIAGDMHDEDAAGDFQSLVGVTERWLGSEITDAELKAEGEHTEPTGSESE